LSRSDPRLDRSDTFWYLNRHFQRDFTGPRGVYGQAAAAGSKTDESINPCLFRTPTARS
jgi:hypothetical protein